MRKRWIWIAPLAILGIVAFLAFGGAIVMQLWNWLVPPLFGWRAVTFWQALGLLALCRILFGGVGARGGGYRGDLRRRMTNRMADRFADRWQRMTPEERERFRQRLRERCGSDIATAASD